MTKAVHTFLNTTHRKYIWITGCLALLLLASSCAYYNTLFNAKKSFNEGLELVKENPDGGTGGTGKASQHFETTIEKCWKLIEIYSDQNKYADDALLYIIKSEFYLGRYTQGRVYLEQFFAKYPESELTAEAQLWYGKMLLAENDIDKANEYFLRVTTNSDNAQLRSSASFELGRYAFENENYDEAIRLLETALKEKIDDKFKAPLLFYLGESYFSQNDYKKAIEQYKRVENSSPEDDIAYRARLNLAKTYIRNQQYKESRKELDRLLSDPKHSRHTPMIQTVIAQSYLAGGDIPRAVELYKENIREGKRSPGTALAAFDLAKIYEQKLNNLDSALAYYGTVEKMFAKFDSVAAARAKITYLGEYRVIRDEIVKDQNLVDRLTNDAVFRDSLLTAQLQDSLRKAQGLPDPVETILPQDTTAIAETTANADSMALTSGNDAQQADSLALAVGQNENVDPFAVGNQDLPGKTNLENEDQSLTTGNPASNNQPPNQPAKPLELRKLPEIEFDLMNNRFHLAEFYLLKVEEYDSAITHYQRFLETYDDSILTPKTMYSLAYIYSTEARKDSARVRALQDQLVAEYPESQFSRNILRERGLLTETDSDTINQAEELAQRRFREAEDLLFAGDYRSALAAYQEVAQLDSAMEISAKAQFASGWILEKNLSEPDRAKAAYEALISRYPDHPKYVKAARIRITPPVERPVFDPNSVVADSLDNSGENDNSEDNQLGEAGIPFEDILAEKIRWRLRRAGSGLK